MLVFYLFPSKKISYLDQDIHYLTNEVIVKVANFNQVLCPIVAFTV